MSPKVKEKTRHGMKLEITDVKVDKASTPQRRWTRRMI